jgi:signal transduction histidine kinase
MKSCDPCPTALLGKHTAILRGGFAMIVLAFLLSNVVAIAEMHSAAARERRLIDRAFSSVDLISRITRDVDQQRLLIDAHIFTSAPEIRKKIEGTLGSLDADYAKAIRAYDPLAKSENERAAWQDLRRAIATAMARIDKVLALSRTDQDAEAIVALEGQFGMVDQAAARLNQITRDNSHRCLAMMRDRQRDATILLAGITLGGTALAMMVALWVSRALRRAREKIHRDAALLEERNRELNAFAGRLAHDIRGPLTTIGLSAATLNKDVPQDDKALASMQRAAARMETLIEDLLTLSRIDAQGGEAVADTTEVVGLFEDELRRSVIAVNGKLRVDVEPAELACRAGLLRQVLWHLGQNAVAYRRPDVALELAIVGRERGRTYQFLISDNGSGMTPEEVRRAWEPLYRGERARAVPGSGIGLTIVKRVVDSCGGTVSIESAPDRGTTVVIELPRT